MSFLAISDLLASLNRVVQGSHPIHSCIIQQHRWHLLQRNMLTAREEILKLLQ